MARIRVTGLTELQKALKDNVTLNDVKKVVRHHGQQMQQTMMQNADFKMGYQTGTTKRSISLEMLDRGMTAEVGPETEYSPYVNYGTRFMEAQPFFSDAVNEQVPKFKKDMQKLTK